MTDDTFDPPGSVTPITEVRRDRWGRYVLPDPTGSSKGEVPFTRATTFAKSISDTYALSQWGKRMVVKGLTLRPDLLALAHNLDVREDKAKLDDIVEDASTAAGNKVAANLGIALHGFTEQVDGAPGDVDDELIEELVPATHRADVQAYRSALDAAGIDVAALMIERIVALPEFEVAGTLDRILYVHGDDGSHDMVIGDLKTGRDLTYGWQEIAIQLLIYALGASRHGVFDATNRTWGRPLSVRTDYAIVVHLPVGAARCTLYRVNLEPAREAMELCRDVRRWRKTRNLAEPLAIAEIEQSPPAVVHSASWEERVAAASSRGELSAIWREAQMGASRDLVARLGAERLKDLEEKAG